MEQKKRLKLTILRIIRGKKERGATYEEILEFIELLVSRYGRNRELAAFLVQVLNREVNEELYRATDDFSCAFLQESDFL